MRLFGTPVTQYLPALALFFITIGYLATAYGYSPDARAIPAGVAWVMLGLVALDLASRTRTPIGNRLMRWLNPAGEAEKKDVGPHYPLMKQIGAAIWVGAFAAAMLLIGILYAVPLYVFASLYFRGRRPLLPSVGIAALATLAIWILFVAVLQLQLYPGVLFGGV